MRSLCAGALAAGLALCEGGCASGDDGAARVLVNERDLMPVGMHGEQEWNGLFQLDETHALPATVEVTSKGNGTLSVGNVAVRVYDDHDDGNLYEPRMLRVLTLDLDDDGWMDLLIVGRRLETGEKGGQVIASFGVAAMLFYDAALGGFRVVKDDWNMVTPRQVPTESLHTAAEK